MEQKTDRFRKQRCCFTGHRPEKLLIPETIVKMHLKKEIETAISEGFCTFITGMARGVDMWAAEIVLDLRKNNSSIHLICAVPYKGFEKKWSEKEQIMYNYILASADIIRYISERYSEAAFQKRNIWMVDRSARVIAVYSGEKGGTENTIKYAEKTGVPVVNICSNI